MTTIQSKHLRATAQCRFLYHKKTQHPFAFHSILGPPDRGIRDDLLRHNKFSDRSISLTYDSPIFFFFLNYFLLFFYSSCNATKSKEPIAFGGSLCIHHTDTQYGPYLSLRLLSAVYPICNFRLFALALGHFYHGSTPYGPCHPFPSSLLSFNKTISDMAFSFAGHFLPCNGCDICYIRSLHPFLTQQPSMSFLPGFIRGSFPCLFLVRSTLYLYELSGFWLILESPLCYLFVRLDFWERFLFTISSVFEYETGWAFHNVVSYY